MPKHVSQEDSVSDSEDSSKKKKKRQSIYLV